MRRGRTPCALSSCPVPSPTSLPDPAGQAGDHGLGDRGEAPWGGPAGSEPMWELVWPTTVLPTRRAGRLEGATGPLQGSLGHSDTPARYSQASLSLHLTSLWAVGPVPPDCAGPKIRFFVEAEVCLSAGGLKSPVQLRRKEAWGGGEATGRQEPCLNYQSFKLFVFLLKNYFLV